MTAVTPRSWDLTTDATTVSGWSRTRLPFEPRGELREYRAALRSALRGLAGQPGAGLLAAYAAPDAGVVDVENVAPYNIGAGSYSHLTAAGIDCRRTTSPDQRHHLTYRVAPLPAWANDDDAGVLADVEAAVPTPAHSPGDWWAALRPHIRGTARKGGHLGPFTVEVVLSGQWTGTATAAAVKPLLDGLISALHAHDGSHASELQPRLAYLGSAPGLWAALCDTRAAVLGPRPLLRPHGERLAWNPADDRCQAFQVRTRPCPERRIRATIRRTATGN